MYIFYSMIQQQYSVIMLHSQDCTVLELGHNGRVPWLQDITLSLQLVQKTSLASAGGITMSMKTNFRREGRPERKNKWQEGGWCRLWRVSTADTNKCLSFYSCSGFDFCVSAQKFPCVDSGDCILNPLLSLRLLQPWILSNALPHLHSVCPCTWTVICAHTAVYEEIKVVRAISNSSSNWHHFSQSINLW